MSEVNSSNEQHSSESASTGSDWFSGWDDFATDAPEAHSEASPVSAPVPDSDRHEWHTVDFPNAISVDAIDRQSLYAQPKADVPLQSAPWEAQAAPNPLISPPTLEEMPALTSQPRIDDLIGLIQELNQCNNALLDRVSQLEESLEHAQRGTQTEQSLGFDTEDALNPPTPEQVAKLSNELEFTRQKDKRQQILLETMKGQLETSQERIAQLERECALTQQRYNEQLQLLNQRENDCRDLRSRLQRQQRYTLQFKAALEKSLEVPPPQYESATEAVEPVVQIPMWYPAEQDPMLLPKGQTIQPWSSQSQSRFLDKLHLSSLSDEAPNLQPLPDKLPDRLATPIAARPAQPVSAVAPVIDLSLATPLDAATLNPENADSAPISYALHQSDPATVDLTPLTVAGVPTEVVQAGLEELQIAVNDLWQEAIAQQAPSNSPAEPAEAALWQDLARLIDVSAEDVVRASLAGDFTLFESIDLQDAVLPSPPPETTQAHVTQTSVGKSTEPTPEAAKELRPPSVPFEANPNSPSPLVHPLRQLKKIKSFAAIDLPKFAH